MNSIFQSLADCGISNSGTINWEVEFPEVINGVWVSVRSDHPANITDYKAELQAIYTQPFGTPVLKMLPTTNLEMIRKRPFVIQCIEWGLLDADGNVDDIPQDSAFRPRFEINGHNLYKSLEQTDPSTVQHTGLQAVSLPADTKSSFLTPFRPAERIIVSASAIKREAGGERYCALRCIAQIRHQ